jgi:serine protease Do
LDFVLPRCLLLAFACVLAPNMPAWSADGDLLRAEQLAFQQAAAAADPSVVRIETVGGVDLVGELLTATGPTTGVVVQADGYIITSRFNFLSRPASVMVTLPDERRFAAEIVSSDLARMVTLLKIDAHDLVPIEAVPKDQFRVGQRAIALGRTFDLHFPSLSVGIISALNRVWGRALQTDAKTSPVNYGGPLIDLSGRCLGVIVPLSPQEQGDTAGVEWYDSGIGFAVPLVDIQAALPRLIAGQTLKPGLLGVGFEDLGPLSGAAKVLRVRPESPADKAGLLLEDVIVGIDGQPAQKLSDLKHVLGTKYAGDVVRLAVRRGDQAFEKDVTLTDELKAYQFPYLGILPERSAAPGGGVKIRAVIDGSPAAQAGLRAGDEIKLLEKVATPTRGALAEQLYKGDMPRTVSLTIQRDGASQTVEAALAAFPSDPPQTLAPENIPAPETPNEAKTGRLNEQLPDEGLGFWAYVPENYRADRLWGLLVWLHPAGDTQEAETLKAWAEVCRARGMILVAPRSGNAEGWAPDQEAEVRAVIDWVQERYRIDPARVAALGRESSAVFASKLAFKYRELFRGLVLLGAPLRVAPPDNDPDFPLQVAFAGPASGLTAKAISSTAEALRKRNFPAWVTTRSKDDEGPFPAEVVSALARWLDALDRI